MRTWTTIRSTWIGIVVLAGIPLHAGLPAAEAAVHKSAQTAAAETKQVDVRKLEVGRPIEREMKGAEGHLYSIAVDSGQYFSAVVEQRGIDVEVTVIAPDGKELFKVDSPNGTEGPEPVEFITESSGVYRLIVKSLEDNAPAGRYEIRVNEVRAATDKDRNLIEKNRMVREAMQKAIEAEGLRLNGRYDEAIRLAEDALSTLERQGAARHPDIAFSSNLLGLLYMYKGDYQRAESMHRKALEIWESELAPDHPFVATSLNNLSEMYSAKGEYTKAEELQKRALRIREAKLPENNPDIGSSLNNLAGIYLNKGDFAQAEPLYKRAISIFEKSGPSNAPLAAALNSLGELYRLKGNYDQAEPLYSRALAIEETLGGPVHHNLAPSLNNLATLYEEEGDYNKAQLFYHRAISILEKSRGGDELNLANSLHGLATTYIDKADYTTAEALLNRALSLREKALGPQHIRVGESQNNLAELYWLKGDYENAETGYKRALTIFENAPGHDVLVATSLNNLAQLYESKGDYENAEPLFLRSLEIYQKVYPAGHKLVSISLSNLARLYQDKGDYPKADGIFQQALDIRRKALGIEHPEVAYLLNNLAQLYFIQGDYSKAETLFKSALAIFERELGGEHSNVATTLGNLSGLYWAKGDLSSAVDFRIRSAEVRERDFVKNLVSGSERQKLTYLQQFSVEASASLSLHLNGAGNDPAACRLALATILRHKGRALDAMTDSIATLRRHASDDNKKLLDELSMARSRRAVLTIRGPRPDGIEKHNANLKVLEAQTDQLENQISQRSLEFRAQLTPVNLENVQKAVPHNAVLVEFAAYRPVNVRAAKKEDRLGKPRYVVYILRATGDPSWVELGDAKQIDDKINAFRVALRNKRSRNVKRLAREVDSLVMQPVRRLLGRTRRVLISPDGALNLIPFAALVDEHNQYLVSRYSFTYLSSGRDLLRLQTKVEGKTSKMVIADPDFGEWKTTATAAMRGNELNELYFSPLRATEEEARELKRLFTDASVLTKGQATEEAIKAVDRPAILHIATHGFFLDDLTQVEVGNDKEKTRIVKIKRAGSAQRDSDPGNLINPLLRSGLGLAGANTGISKDGNDGILTSLEAAGLDLWGTKLVVLSACDTGVGKVVSGDGVYGLRRALILAGSESQMISLWPVSDTGTSRLMTGYYEALKAGAGRSEALRQVQLRMLRDPKSRHPFYWASFIQSGEWASLEGKR